MYPPETPTKLWSEEEGDGGLLQPLDPEQLPASFLNDFFGPGGEGTRILALYNDGVAHAATRASIPEAE
jgi:hypothetical protein